MRDPVARITSDPKTHPEVNRIFQHRTDMRCRQTIKMCKTMTEFRDLCENDQIILLKTSCFEMLCFVSVLTFDFTDQFWTVYIDSENAAMLRLEALIKWGKMNLYDILINYMFKLNQEYNQDTNLIDLLMAIIVFNPNRPNLKQTDQVMLQRETYIYLLHRYLELKHNSKTEAEIRFTRLMNCLQDLYTLRNVMKSNYISSDPKNGHELVIEIIS
ncbi:unnamed protein product [Medioppia subpectinata]|uniref:NR LBD domain-containing protein n=1 Tax=Medioppia subpectinata TaxID=1979941 RepID=A0A7R9Q433_9ACAR|nr:unnamed protein product [Medioppia subpectinata]CAG2112147.1 unnamed protein product [Medioppia subpectinata]